LFKIVDLHGDNKFAKIQNAILLTNLTLAAAREHVGVIERSVRTMTENSHAGLHGTPFKQVPIVMVKGLLKLATILLTAFPSKAGISDTLRPHNIVQGLPNIDFAQLKYEFGKYGELSEDSTVTNTQAGRTKGALALYPRGQHGSWAFLSLSTGKEVHGRTFTPIGDSKWSRISTALTCSTATMQILQCSKIPSLKWANRSKVSESFYQPNLILPLLLGDPVFRESEKVVGVANA